MRKRSIEKKKQVKKIEKENDVEKNNKRQTYRQTDVRTYTEIRIKPTLYDPWLKLGNSCVTLVNGNIDFFPLCSQFTFLHRIASHYK